MSALSRPQEALAEYDAALSRNETSVAALYNRSLALRTLGRTVEAAQACERVIALQPDLAMAHMHLAVCRLQLGDLLGGFTGYEWRKRTPDFVDHRYDSPLNWRGEDLTGRTLYIYPERFLGDMIQFCRYAAEAERRGVRVVLAAQRPLHALLRSLSPTITLLEPDEAPSTFDAQCALLSLPLAFGAEIPASVPYLAAEPDRQNRWRRRVGDAGFKIGVCWQGSTKAYAEPLQRSFRLDQLAPLAADPAVRLISLQKHDGLDQLDALPAGMRVETFDDADAGPEAFVDTAAIIMACDLVVTADTAIAHLAGALGRPVWVALPALAEWRWMEARDDSPWYPSMRLFRQRIQGQWRPVFDDMAQALKLARH